MRDKKSKPDWEMIPLDSDLTPLWRRIPDSQWRKVSREVRARVGDRCQICGSVGGLHCHEVWKLIPKKRTVRLTALQALCNECHQRVHHDLRDPTVAYHPGAMGLGSDRVIRVYRRTVIYHESWLEAFYRVAEREKRGDVWKVDLGKFQAVVKKQ